MAASDSPVQDLVRIDSYNEWFLTRMASMRNYRAILASTLASLRAALRRLYPSAADANSVEMDVALVTRLQADRPPARRRTPTAETAKITTERQLERLNQNRARARNIK